jgi:Protein of unknown function (DUF3592)
VNVIEQRRGVLQAIGVANLIIGVILLIFSVPFFWHQIDVLRTWPTADAQVLHSDVVVERISQHEQFYSARLGLLYTIDGKPITTEVTSFQDNNYKKTRARADEYAAGSHHEIRYDPHNPMQARIGAGWNLRFFALPLAVSGCGVAFGIIAGALLVVARRR